MHSPHSNVPERLASEYSNAERKQFEDEFKQLAEHYRAKRKRAKQWINAFFLCVAAMVVGSLVHNLLLFGLSGIAGVLAWLCGHFNSPKLLICPACQQNLLGGFGKFCPECDGNLGRVSFIDDTRCSSCAKKLCLKGGRNFRMRYCTYCGLKLEDEGM